MFCQGVLTGHQAVHPFYVFQIASLILWSLDSYYYYATCIFIISVFSIATTIVETKTVSQHSVVTVEPISNVFN